MGRSLGSVCAAEIGSHNPPELKGINNLKYYDKELLKFLFEKWDEKYIERKSEDWELRCLFRSLEMAYNACSIPFENQGTPFDYGTKLSLWVSAFEILVHPENNNVDLEKVLKLIGKAKLDVKELDDKIYIRKGRNGEEININLLQELYCQIYNTRNSFLHGNKVNAKDLFPFKNKNGYPLNNFAPLLYSVTLRLFMDKFYDKINIFNDEDICRLGNYMNLYNSLLKALEDSKNRFI